MPKRVSVRSSIVRAAPTSACRMARVASTSTAFANAAKIAVIHLDKPFDRQAILQLPGDDLKEPMKEIGGRLAVDARQIPRAPSRHSNTKLLASS